MYSRAVAKAGAAKKGKAVGGKASTKLGWRVVRAEFELSSPDLAQCPAPDRPEVAVAGRSNVGKSSLLNAFCNRRGLARVSGTPGRTQLLNFFQVTLMGPTDQRIELRLVDLPGYGFAAGPKRIRDSFGPMIGDYLRDRGALRGMLALVDARRGPSDMDIGLLEFGSQAQLPSLVVATKCDKMGASQRGLVAGEFAKALSVARRDVLLTSAQSGLGLAPDAKGPGLGRELARMCRMPPRMGTAEPSLEAVELPEDPLGPSLDELSSASEGPDGEPGED